MIRLKEKIDKYKSIYNENLKQIFMNEKIESIINSLNDKESFKNIDVDELISLLSKTNINDHIKTIKVKNTIEYVKINDNLDEYREILKSVFEYLIQLKKETPDKQECELIIKKCDNLLENINDNQYLEDFDFIFKIFSDLKIDIKEIGELVKIIDSHNRDVSKNNIDNKNSVINSENFEELPEFIIKNRDNFTSNEISILNGIYETESQRIDEIYSYIVNSPKLSVITDELKQKNNKQLFLSLLLFSTSDILKKVDSVCDKYSIEMIKLLPTFFISEKTLTTKINDDFYGKIVGNYENFVSVVNGLSTNSFDINKLINECVTLFMTSTSNINKNINILKEYEILLMPSMLQCLAEENLTVKIDRFIEAGLYDYLKKFPTILLNKDDALFHRIYYARKNNIPIKKRGLLKNITDSDGLGINYQNYKNIVLTYTPMYFNNNLIYKNSLHDYIDINHEDFNKNFEFLKDCEENGVYNIDGVFISKRKVMRIFSSLINEKNNSHENSNYPLKEKVENIRNIIFSLVSDLILDEEEYKKTVLYLLKRLGADKLRVGDSIKNSSLDILRANFDLSFEDLEFLVQRSKRNGGY